MDKLIKINKFEYRLPKNRTGYHLTSLITVQNGASTSASDKEVLHELFQMHASSLHWLPLILFCKCSLERNWNEYWVLLEKKQCLPPLTCYLDYLYRPMVLIQARLFCLVWFQRSLVGGQFNMFPWISHLFLHRRGAKVYNHNGWGTMARYALWIRHWRQQQWQHSQRHLDGRNQPPAIG